MVMLLRVIKDLTITIKRDNYDYRRVARPVEIVRRETINLYKVTIHIVSERDLPVGM